MTCTKWNNGGKIKTFNIVRFVIHSSFFVLLFKVRFSLSPIIFAFSFAIAAISMIIKFTQEK